MAAVHLAPVNPPLGVNPSFCRPHQMTLKLREKVWSLSGDTFEITDAAAPQGQDILLECRGQKLSLSDRKEFSMPGPQGGALFSLRTKLITFPHKSFYAEAPDGKILFEVKGKFAIGKSKMIATFTNASNGAAVELVIKGDWLDRSASITMGNLVVATISRNFLNAGQIFGNQQTYYVTVAPGVDYAMIAAMCVCLDEKENEKK